MVGVVGGDQPGASSWYQAVNLGLSLSSGSGKTKTIGANSITGS